MTGEPVLRAVLWDMDGTLTDTERLWEISIAALAHELGHDLTEEEFEPVRGASSDVAVRQCLIAAGHPVDSTTVQFWCEWVFADVGRRIDAEAVPCPGVPRLLEDLRAVEMPMYVATNTERELVDRTLRTVGTHYFRGSVAGDEVEDPKPSPDIYVEAARRLAVEPEDCLVFEDSWHGMTAAVAAGCPTVGLVSSGTDCPEGAVALADLHTSATLVGASAADVVSFYQRASMPVRPASVSSPQTRSREMPPSG